MKPITFTTTYYVPQAPRQSHVVRSNVTFQGQPEQNKPHSRSIVSVVLDFIKHPQIGARIGLGFKYMHHGPQSPMEEKIRNFYTKNANHYLSLVLLICFPLYIVYNLPNLAIKAKKFLVGFFTPHDKINEIRAQLTPDMNKRTPELDEPEP